MSEALKAQFDRLRPHIEAAVAHGGETTVDAVLSEVLAGRAQLWPGENAVLVTQCVAGPDGRLIHAWLGGGILSELMAMRPGVEAWGRAMGAQYATLEGRAGWERVYRRYGYEPGPDGVLRKAL